MVIVHNTVRLDIAALLGLGGKEQAYLGICIFFYMERWPGVLQQDWPRQRVSR